MNQFRQPVIHRFEQLSFEVDIEKQVLRQTNDQSHEISFIKDMTDLGDHYLLPFDLSTKRVADQTSNPDHVEPIIVPAMVALDPEGMATKYGLTQEQLKGKTDFEVIVDQQALEQRHKGVLPQIDIAGEKFTVDLRLQELRHSQYFFPALSLKSFELTSDGWHYEAYYHPVIKQTVELDPKLLEFPEGVIRIKIPNELGLDPVATAAIYGMSEREVLRRHPIPKELKAELIPLAETEVPRLIRQNREQLQQEHRENAQKLQPRRRLKF